VITRGTNGRGLTVAALAEDKGLPVEFLRGLGLHDLPGGVGIPYYGPTGEDIAVKQRTAATATDGSYWPEGVPLAAYGQWRNDEANRAGFLIINEGESDPWTLWYHGLPGLGLPGSGTACTLLREHVEAVETVYIVREPDRGGEAFVRGVLRRLAALGFAGKVYELRMPDGVKDPNDLHKADPGRFKERLGEAMKAAAPLELPPPAGATGQPDPPAWPDPIPLGDLPDVPAFPVDALPGQIADLVEEIAWAKNCPPDFGGVTVLALAGGALANSRHLAITKSHTQSSLLYAAIIGLPGTVKSPVLKTLRRPFDRVQQRYLADWEAEMETWNATEKKERGPRPVLKRCVVSDATTESLGIVLQENPRGVVMIRDELVGLIAGMNQYKAGKGHDRQVYLALWSGDTIITDRKGDASRQGAPLYVADPFAAIVGCLQPAVLERLRGESVRGVPPPDDGFLDRFLVAYPADLPATGEQWREVSQEALDAWQKVIERLLGLSMVEQPDDRPRPFYVHLTPCGRDAWVRFTQAHADEMNAPNFPMYLRGPWSKLRGYGARLALIVHFLRWAVGEATGEDVDGESLDRAAKLVAYFKAHARKAYSAMDADPRIAETRKLYRWLAANELRRFSKRDAYQALKGTFRTVAALEPVLALLERHALIRPEPTADHTGRGRKTSPFYEVHPRLPEVDPHNSHNPQNQPVTPDSGDCGNCGDRPGGEESPAGGECSTAGLRLGLRVSGGNSPTVTMPKRRGTL
jgi:hypothetical protein